MELNHNQFIDFASLSIFVSIIGTAAPHRRAAASFSHQQALDELIEYLNMMMDEVVLPEDANEEQVRQAYADNLYQPVEIIKCE
ncbi:hypothetical protein GRI44_13745 [Altererythrobacter confluentis]|uniref:Uncharacterized protein n=1 Tax=Allopontixanthobacter confluentis TaxID=1849021 RepID=A0A6L7GII5_9SPHN|nr:hypothetical protein [Allopontixanthobacter confluentis]MXP15812.1 hypothetical protein [Allopontixanthobacter confluentis]